jgi:hypothetical protein
MSSPSSRKKESLDLTQDVTGRAAGLACLLELLELLLN